MTDDQKLAQQEFMRLARKRKKRVRDEEPQIQPQTEEQAKPND